MSQVLIETLKILRIFKGKEKSGSAWGELEEEDALE